MVLPDGGGLETDTPLLREEVTTGVLGLGGEPGAQSAIDQTDAWTLHEPVVSPQTIGLEVS